MALITADITRPVKDNTMPKVAAVVRSLDLAIIPSTIPTIAKGGIIRTMRSSRASWRITGSCVKVPEGKRNVAATQTLVMATAIPILIDKPEADCHGERGLDTWYCRAES